ncbi:MAG: RagB/SusD family nutrient uptake outer membrane protein [Bacteroidales bacterium]|nr:RagB/SusD family nutrient uptake outer membrane protein [Bacteroidales bacterium]
MKAIHYISVFAAALLTLQACNDNLFLEEHPKAMYTIDNAFETSDQITNQLTLCYSSLYNWYANTGWNIMFQYKNFGTDVMDQPYFRSNGVGWSNFSSGHWTTTSGHISQTWSELYRVLSFANLALRGCESESIQWADETHRKNVSGEAHFFRGLCYLRLGELFGGVPIVKEYDEANHDDYVRASSEETYQFAIDELELAYNGLADYPSMDGKVAKGAAGHMLAEAYLAMGVLTGKQDCYTRAANYAQSVIDLHPLMKERFGVRANSADTGSYHGIPTYFPNGSVVSDLFTAGNFDRSAGNTEAIWVIETPTYEQSDEYGGSVISVMQMGMVARDLNWAPEYVEPGAAAGPWKGTPHPVYGGNFSAYVGGFGIAEVGPTNYAGYDVWTDPDDLRYQAEVTVRRDFICFDQKHSMFNKPVTREMLDPNPANISKYFPMFAKLQPLDDWTYRDTDMFHMNYSSDAYAIRSAETYLLLAEAKLRSGDKAGAAAAVNALRTRANCSTLFTADEMDINVILDERIRELIFEEGRWFTFLRMEPQVWKQRIYDHAMYWKDYPTYSTPIAWDLWPIPQDIIDLNTGAPMEQNPGWK